MAAWGVVSFAIALKNFPLAVSFFKTKPTPGGRLKSRGNRRTERICRTGSALCPTAGTRRGSCALGGVYDVTASRLIRYATHADPPTRRRRRCAAGRPGADCSAASACWPRHAIPGPTCSRSPATRRSTSSAAARPMRPLTATGARILVRILLRAGRARIAQLVRRALGKLPPPQAEVVVLKIWEEMTFAEIGEVLGQSPNTAASRYRYALQKLSQHLHSVVQEVRHA